MSTYYVVKKRDPGEIFGTIVTILVVIAIIIVITIYAGLIFLGIIALIAGCIGFFYALVVYLKAAVIETKTFSRPANAKELFKNWSTLTISTSKRSFQDNLRHSSSIWSKGTPMRVFNPIKYLLSFLAVFISLLGIIFIVCIGLFQFLLMGFLILSIATIFVLMICVASIASLFIFVPMGFVYLTQSINYVGGLRHIFKVSTYYDFSGMGGEIKDYWRKFADIIIQNERYLVQAAFNNVFTSNAYAFYSPLKYGYLSSFIWLFLDIGIVTICFAIAAAFFFLFELTRRVVCSLIKVIFRR